MRFTVRLFLYWVLVFMTFYLAVLGVGYLLWGLTVSVWQAALVFFLAGVVPPALITGYYFKRLDYMESELLTPPPFEGQKKARFSYRAKTDSPFDEVMQRIDRQWIISFSDRRNKVLKFRTDSRMMSWGVGGYLSMPDNNTIEVIVYPIHPNSRREKLILTQLLRLMASVLKS